MEYVKKYGAMALLGYGGGLAVGLLSTIVPIETFMDILANALFGGLAGAGLGAGGEALIKRLK